MNVREWGVIGLAALAGVLLLAAACGGGESEGSGDDLEIIVVTDTAPAPTRARRTPSPTPVASPTPLAVCAPNPDPAPSSVLQVEEPKPEAQVRVPFHVRGWVSKVVPTPAPTPEGAPPAPEPAPAQIQGVFLAVVNQKQDVVQLNELPALSREYRVAPPGMVINEFTRPFAADIVLNDLTEPTPFCLWVFLSRNDQNRAQGVVQIPVVVHPR